MIGIACGLAANGKIPFASTFAVFATSRCFDQIRVSVAQAKLNVKIVSTHSGLTVGEDGASHQALEDLALILFAARLYRHRAGGRHRDRAGYPSRRRA